MRKKTSSLDLVLALALGTQYVLVRMLPGAWQIQITPNILVDWKA